MAHKFDSEYLWGFTTSLNVKVQTKLNHVYTVSIYVLKAIIKIVCCSYQWYEWHSILIYVTNGILSLDLKLREDERWYDHLKKPHLPHDP